MAIPHAAVEGLERPLLALGRSTQGIDFDAPDGRPARFVFLLLIPPKAYEEEVRILASIARATYDARAREEPRGRQRHRGGHACPLREREAHARVDAAAGVGPEETFVAVFCMSWKIALDDWLAGRWSEPCGP